MNISINEYKNLRLVSKWNIEDRLSYGEKISVQVKKGFNKIIEKIKIFIEK